MAWTSVTERYDRATDSVELVDYDGEVVGRLHRNAVIRMIGLLPSEPPEEVEDD